MIKQALDDRAGSLIALVFYWGKNRGWPKTSAFELNETIYPAARICIDGLLKGKNDKEIIEDVKINFLSDFFSRKKWTETTNDDFCQELLTPFLAQQRSVLQIPVSASEEYKIVRL